MAKPIIGGPDSSQPQRPRATSGGVMSTKKLPYSTPQGPTEQMRRAVGLGGQNFGNSQCHYPAGTSGKPGIGGDKPLPDGSQ